MPTVSIKSDIILKHAPTIYNHLKVEKRDKLNELFSDYRHYKVFVGFFFTKRKVLITDEDIIDYIKTQLSWMDDDKFTYYKILGNYNDLLDKFDLVVNMAKMSNHVVFSEKERYFINLIRKCELGEI